MQVRCSVRVWRDRGKYISAAFLFYLWICAYCAEFQLSLIVFLFTRSENFARKCISVGKQTVPGLEDQPFWSDPKRLLKWECVVIAFRISLVSLVLPCLNLRCQAYWKLYIFCCAYFFRLRIIAERPSRCRRWLINLYLQSRRNVPSTNLFSPIRRSSMLVKWTDIAHRNVVNSNCLKEDKEKIFRLPALTLRASLLCILKPRACFVNMAGVLLLFVWTLILLQVGAETREKNNSEEH